MFREQPAEPGRIQHRAGAQDASARPVRGQPGHVRENIDGIGGDQHDGIGVDGLDVGDDGRDDARVDLQQFEAALAGAGLRLAGGDDHDGGVAVGVGGRGGVDGDVGIKGRAVGEVEALALGQVRIDVDDGDFLCDAGLGQGKGEAGADRTGTDHHHFPGFEIRHVSPVRPEAPGRRFCLFPVNKTTTGAPSGTSG